MKKLFEQYGSAIVSVILALLILGVLLKNPVLEKSYFNQMIGKVITYSVDEKEKRNNETFENYMNTSPPQISWKDDANVMINQRVLLTDLFEAKAWNGASLPIFLQRAWRLNGSAVNLGESEDGASICVPEAGIYWVQLYAVDEMKKDTSVMVKLVVNER